MEPVVTNSEPLLSLRGISKRFGGIHALENVDLDLYDKEILALLGDNGAGKSTLIKIISGVYKPDTGKIIFQGKEIEIRDPDHAKRLGIKTVHQDLGLFTILDVPSNLFAGAPLTNRWGFLRSSEMRRQSKEILSRLNITVKSLGQPVGSLSGGQRHAVAIGRAVYVGQKPKVVIMDEPTAGLGVEQTRKVLDLLKRLRQQVGIIFITHNLNYAFEVADRAEILASGHVMGVLDMNKTSEEEIVSLMMGRKVQTSNHALKST